MLTEHQNEAYQVLSAWLHDPTVLFAKLRGFPGVGKTYLTTELIKDARKILVPDPLEEFKAFEACVSAPTHQAKKVIEKDTKCTARTIQSLLGLALNIDIENFDINNPEFAIKREPTMGKYNLVIIDEFSMVNGPLLELVITTAVKYGTKVLFIYDEAQLPAVGEDEIAIHIRPSIGIEVILTEVVRTVADSPITQVCMQIRKNIKSMDDLFQHKTNINADRSSGMVFLNDEKDFGMYAVNKMWTAFNEGTLNNYKILAWSNKKTAKWNSEIRSVFRSQFPEEDPILDYFLPNEILVSYTTKERSILTTSEEYTIVDPQFTKKNIKYFERDDEGDMIPDEKSVDVDVIVGRLKIYGGSDSEDVTILVPTPENIKEFMKPFKWYHSRGSVNRKWKEFLDWKSTILLLFPIVGKNNKLICKRDLDYAYAVTVHKSQGTTYHNAYIDEVDINQLEDYNFNKYLYENSLAKLKTRISKAKFLKKYPNLQVFHKKQQEFKNRLKLVSFSRSKYYSVVYTNKV